MEEPRDPEPTPPGEPHGLREEIAEVVEHVPRPVRRTAVRIAWLVGLGVLLVLVIAVGTALLYVAHRTEWVAQELSLFLNQALASRSDVVVHVRDLRGNPLTGLTLVEPEVRFRSGGAPPLLKARAIAVSYSAWSVVAGRDRVIQVSVDQPIVQLVRGPDGSLRLPRWESGGGKGGGRPLEVRLQVRGARVLVPRGMDGVEGLDLDLDLRSGAETRVDIARLAWKRGPFRTTLDALRGEAILGDSVHVRVRELSSPELALRGDAAWAAKGGERRVHLEVSRLRWPLLARLFDNDSFDVPGEGALTIDARGDRRWNVAFRSTLDWNGFTGAGAGRATWDGSRLRVEPLALSSPAGSLRGWVAYEKRGWEVGGDVAQGDPARWGPLHITGWPAGHLNGRFRYAVDTHLRSRSLARLDALLGGSDLAGWRVDSATVAIDFPSDAPTRFTVAARRLGGGFGLEAATDPAGWSGTYTISDLPLEEWPDGRASGLKGLLRTGAGTVRSTDAGLFVTGSLEGQSGNWLGMQAARWRLEGVDGRLQPTPDLSATARLSNLMYLGVHFDSATVAFGLGNQEAALRRVEAHAADTLVTADGRARWDSGGWSVDLDHASARSDQFAWSADPPVRLSGDPREVRFDRLVGRDGDARLEIAGQWAGAGGTYDWTLTGSGLELGRLGLPMEWGLSGRADVRLDVHGVSGDPRWTLLADASRPGLRGHDADSLHVVLAGSRSRAEMREGLLQVGGGRLAGSLAVEGTQAPWPDSLSGPGVVRWLATGARWDGGLHADRLPVENADVLLPQAQGCAGALSGALEIHGRPAAPDLTLDGTVDAARWRDFVAETIHGAARYRDGRLTVDQLRIVHARSSSEITGSMPLALALGRPVEVPDQPMSWKLDVPEADLSLLPLVVPQVAFARGRITGRASAEGTPHHPRLSGYAHVRDGALRLEGREEVLGKLSADLRFSESQITLDSLTAQEGARGRVAASGQVELRGFSLKDYRFDLKLRNFAAVEQGLYAAAFDGDFVVTNGPRLNGQTLPMVEGSVTLERAAILFDFANQTEMQRLAANTQPLFWVYRVQVGAANNLHWQPPNGDIEFSADLTVEQTADSLLIFGDMTSLRGTYWFLSNRFQVDKANLTFDNVSGVDPVLDVSATTRIVSSGESYGLGAATASSGPTTHVITAAIQGRSSKPTISLTDDQSTWDQARILRELTLGTLVGPGGALSGDPLDNYVTRSINRTLSAEMSRLFQGYVNEWALERERGGLFTGTGDLVATVGVPVGRNLSVRYQRRLGLSTGADLHPVGGATDDLFDRNLEAEYRLSRFFYITTEYVTRRFGPTGAINTSGATDLNVNLKARWEY